MPNHDQNAISIIRRRRLEQRVGLSRSTIYDKLNPKSPRYDNTFPRPIRLGGAAVGWLEHEVDDWLNRQIQASRAAGR
jgi:prophage regulatory protein